MKDFTFNKDQDTRDKLLGIPPTAKYGGGIEAFTGLTAETLRQLVDQSFADPEDAQNSAPTIGEFLEFMEAHPKFRAFGYAVGIKRSDYRVSIEGCECAKGASEKDQRDFTSMFRFADDFKVGRRCFCWFD